MMNRFKVLLTGLWLLCLTGLDAAAQEARPSLLSVDATEAAIGLLHAHFVFPSSPGEISIAYPKWIPGEHAPTGPINQVVRLVFTANGKQLSWRRDGAEPFLFHVQVPAGVNQIEADLDFACAIGGGGFTPAVCSSHNELVLNWNLVVIYPTVFPIDQNMFKASLKLPKGWRFASPLPIEKQDADEIQFGVVSLKALVDSPLLAGKYFETFSLGGDHPVDLDLLSETPEGLLITREQKTAFANLVAEASALFGVSRYSHYHMQLTLGDSIDHYTVEHFEASENRMPARGLVDPRILPTSGSLVPHEYIHSWNGKYRPPMHLDNPSYLDPVDGSLLWVYEGLTDYYGNVLAARSGLWTPEQFRESLAIDAAQMATHPGRTWRSLQDTTTGAQLLYNATTAWSAARRSTDFYPESGLIWLDADTIIRGQSKGAKSLDDFCKTFYAPQDGRRPKPYTFDDVISAMNSVWPYDWKTFFRQRLDSTSPQPPLDGIERSGWRLTYSEQKTQLIDLLQQTRKIDLLWPLWEKSDFTDLRYSIGLLLNDDGTVLDSVPGMAAHKAGILPGMQLMAINGLKFSLPVVETAVLKTKTGAPLEIFVANDASTYLVKLDYHEGAKYPQLSRDSTHPDILTAILAPKAAAKNVNKD